MVHHFRSKHERDVYQLQNGKLIEFVGHDFVTDDDAVAADLESRSVFGKSPNTGVFWKVTGEISVPAAAKRPVGRPRKHTVGARGTAPQE